MSDNWEVVGGGKKPNKPKTVVGNGHGPPSKPALSSPAPPARAPAKPKRKKFLGPRDSKIAPPPSFAEDQEEEDPAAVRQDGQKSKAQAQKKSGTGTTTKAKESAKPSKDLEGALRNVPSDQLRNFYTELTNAGSTGDVYLSWIKYSADALNSKLLQLHVPLPPPELFPNDLYYPLVPEKLLQEINYIITSTAQSRPEIDVIGQSFVTLLTMIPTFVQRGDAGWGYLLFLRELVHLDPDLPLRKAKAMSDIMESYGNRKEIGICLLWVSAQAALHSDNLLKIASLYFLPYYNFKHYKSFVLSALGTIGEAGAMENVVEPAEFEEFFLASFDPKKKKDFEKFYPKFRDLTLRNLRSGRGPALFTMFMDKLSDKFFLPLSPYGQEVFEILHGCLDNDRTVIESWKESLETYPRESYLLLQHLSKNPEKVTKYAKGLESTLITSDEFAVACVKSPELLRVAKKLQTGVKRVEESKKKFPWKSSCLLILLIISGLFWLDVTENGKGIFAKSKTGKFLESYGLLDEVTFVIENTVKLSKQSFTLGSKVVRDVSDALRPVLQPVEKQLSIYIPQLLTTFHTLYEYVLNSWEIFFKFLTEQVFVGQLSPENLRKIAKETLSLIWTNAYNLTQRLYKVIEEYLVK